MANNIYTASYYPVGDLIVVSICIVMVVLLLFSYNRKSRSFLIFIGIIGLLVLSAFTNVTYNMLSARGESALPAIKALRCLYHSNLFGIFLLYIHYILEVTRLEKPRARRYMGAGIAIYLAVVATDVITTLRGGDITLTASGVTYRVRGVFLIGYLAFVALIVVLMFNIRNRLYRKVMLGFYGAMAISFIMLGIQGMHGQTSFTVVTFLYPVIAMFYIMHSSPYDAWSGAMDIRALDDLVQYDYQNHVDFVFMSVYLPEFDGEGRTVPEEIQAVIRDFSVNYFKRCTLFRVGHGHLLLFIPKKYNIDYEERMQRIMSDFKAEYRRFKYDYKVVVGSDIPEISRNNEYPEFIRGIHRSMEKNTIRWVVPDDVRRFRRYEKLQEALADISAGMDPDDPRVLVYCQPVYNIHTGRYDTAEALMRMELEELGMVYPDRFIPLAEENGQIHALTMIILHKTCGAVRDLLDRGYEVSRVSVNVSAIELKAEGFCEDIVGVIAQSGIPGEKIAIELTESRTDSDFDHMKQRIEELRQHGIKFYLDDFGTGYSNMERIMQLPFDIIKFDRSMVLASEANERSHAIVLSLAQMFDALDYSVLYEGVEKDSDEKMCIDMSASYLQGYKYSRPVPIERLEDYFSKAA